MQIKAAVTRGKGEPFSVETLALTEPGAKELRLRIVATGVCHTDAVAREMGLTPFPVVLGHEGAGIVEAVGSEVTAFAPGDHVVLSFAHCGGCEHCLTGYPSACMRMNELNFGGRAENGACYLHHGDEEVSTFFGQSSFGSHAVVHERNVVKVDPDLDLGVLAPLGCGIQTGSGTVFNRLKPAFGSSLVVYGCGAVGLSAIMAARIAGCSRIIAVDVHDNRLTLAKELGATHAFNGSQVDVVEEIRAVTGAGAHYAVETTGVPQVVRQGLHALRPLGQLAIVGVTPEVTLDVHNDLMAEGKTMMGVIEGDSVPKVFIPQLIEYYRQGQFPFDKLITFYEFDALEDAFSDSKSGKTIKPVVRMNS
ncbi:NAD(P)-dependent alcohol dehydrogenase [Chromohalobacter nigrandesensis]|uniref:NAD(P)-dependent alcohol dehydrogenase n=1 Tax=Chromohalobacter nigrandesensis TaxID=119863 RepID=UPI001FF1618D|nr:NAD(P)-dependent alcohol dehydrogenase [Chromohalobacter nigrandesensis]MCK0745212.1 NAD(P)-dependent alcohol dehydrogenase [Chromohalobacter nigrandesensis]